MVVGSLTWGVLSELGLSALLERYADLAELIRIAGGLYLLWLAYKSLRTAMSTHVHDELSPATPRPGIGQLSLRLAIHLTNPKSILAWIAIIAIGVTLASPSWTTLVIVAGCWLAGLIVFGGYAIAFSTKKMILA
ncbi:MAG: LysE family transporter [Pseudomonadota bacterium]